MRPAKVISGNKGKFFGLWSQLQVNEIRADYQARLDQLHAQLQATTEELAGARNVVRRLSLTLGQISEGTAQWLDQVEGKPVPEAPAPENDDAAHATSEGG